MKKAITLTLFGCILFAVCFSATRRKRKPTPAKPNHYACGYTKIEYGLAVNSKGDTIKIKEIHQYK